MEGRLDLLTAKERECLRLVSHERKSAVIADMLGIAVPTVETHIRSARSKLGGVSRFAAAKMLREAEAGRQPSTSQPSTMPSGRIGRVGHEAFPSSAAGSQPLRLSDVRPAFDPVRSSPPSEKPRTRNDLSTLNRIALVAFTVLAIAIAGIASIPLSDAVQRVARMVMTQRH